MASYAPSSISLQDKAAMEKGIPIEPPVEGDEEESSQLLSRLQAMAHGRALIALALFFPIGIFALIFSLLERRHTTRGNVQAARKAAERAERLTVASYRVGVVILVTLAILILGVLVGLFCRAIDEAHKGDHF